MGLLVRRCGRPHSEILVLALPYGQGSLLRGWKLERVLNELSCNVSLLRIFGFAWQSNLVSDSHTSFRGHFSHNENSVTRGKNTHPATNEFE